MPKRPDPSRPRPAMRLLAMGTLAVVLAACSGPGPTRFPSGSPSRSPASPSPSPTAGAIDHPTGAEDVVLRMEQTGGLAMVAMLATRVPTFTLYGDGSVIYLPRDLTEQPGGGPELPPLRRATMTEEAVQALLRFALGQGRLLQAREQYRADNVADATSTVFTVDAGGVRKQVDVYALGEAEPEGADRQDRLAFRQVAEVLGDFGAEVRRGQATDAGVYHAAAYRGLLEPAEGGFGEARDWPFQTLSPEDFKPTPDFQRPVAVVPEAEALRVSDTAYGGVISVVLTGPDRTPYYFSMRPLLPEELP